MNNKSILNNKFIFKNKYMLLFEIFFGEFIDFRATECGLAFRLPDVPENLAWETYP